MRKLRSKSALLAALFFCTYSSHAHFQMIIPSDDILERDQGSEIKLDLMFWHPFEGHGIDMAMPKRFGVYLRGKEIDLLDTLQASRFPDSLGQNHHGFSAAYTVKKPGNHIFYVQPRPYWEPAEQLFIVHYTKVVMNAFGLELGWDQALGLKTEIVPLSRPYGLYAGNVFQGVVMLNGKPAPGTEVEVEYYNDSGQLSAPAEVMITQVVKTDDNGVFTYAMPKAGWWGFAALNEDTAKMKRGGKEYPVEIGAVIWVRTHAME